MLHWIAFVVIGLLWGGVAAWAIDNRSPALVVVGGLVGSLVGGEVMLLADPGATGSYGSLLTALFLAMLLSWVVSARRAKSS